jgi:Ulp1 protease family, C-terminal catalytic domain
MPIEKLLEAIECCKLQELQLESCNLQKMETYFGERFFLRANVAIRKRCLFTAVRSADFAREAIRPNGKTRFCDLHLQDLHSKRDCFGLILNTAPSTRPGEHWVALWVCRNPESPNFGMYFYDSTSTPNISKYVPSYVKRLRAKFMLHAKEMDLDGFHFHVNRVIHQESDGTCGLYCLAFMYACLLDLPLQEYFHHDGVNDDLMQAVMSAVFATKTT